MKKISCITTVVALLSLLTSCEIHEFPVIPTHTTFTLHLDFNTELPLHKEVQYASTRATNDAEAYDVRHIVSIHRLHPDGHYERTPDTLIVTTLTNLDNLNWTLEFMLPEGDYNFFVWSDYVSKGSSTDYYYNTNDFAEIILRDKQNYHGNTDYRDAFRGQVQATVTVMKNEMMEVHNEATVTMRRPLAKFKLISVDYARFVEKVLKSETRIVNPDEYHVVVRYVGFMPCSYNMFTDYPADSWMGVSFTGALKPTEEGEVELGFDYVFVNGTETVVQVNIEVYSKEGVLLATSPSYDVPLSRSRLTIVKGYFLTSEADGGIGISPEFDGEYNIEIK